MNTGEVENYNHLLEKTLESMGVEAVIRREVWISREHAVSCVHQSTKG